MSSVKRTKFRQTSNEKMGVKCKTVHRSPGIILDRKRRIISVNISTHYY